MVSQEPDKPQDPKKLGPLASVLLEIVVAVAMLAYLFLMAWVYDAAFRAGSHGTIEPSTGPFFRWVRSLF